MTDALAELGQRLAGSPRVQGVSAADVQEVAARHGVHLTRRFRRGLRDLYRTYLVHCLSDRSLGDDEIEDLRHLKQLFGLDDRDVGHIHEEVAREVYARSVAEALEDGRLSDAERAFLCRLERELKLPDEMARRVFEAQARLRVQAEIAERVADERLSPEEEEELAAISRSLGVELQADKRTRELLDRCRLYWMIESGDVPTVAVEAGLLRNRERPYATREAEWFELRERREAYRRAGASGRVRLAKGIYLRSGEVGVKKIVEETLELIDSGRAHLTDQRLILAGRRGRDSVEVDEITAVSPFENGIEIVRAEASTLFLGFRDDVDLFALLLERALRDRG